MVKICGSFGSVYNNYRFTCFFEVMTCGVVLL